MSEIRTLRADEIECRVAQVRRDRNKKMGCSLLLYKDARVDMRMLDEIYGATNWKRTHQLIGDRLYCTIEVWDDAKKQWIAKQDVGTESNTEKEKGQASDSFKRAGFNWGIGRELYTAPFIWIPLQDGEWYENERTKKPATNTKFHVKTIEYNESREISRLGIKEDKDIRYNYTHSPRLSEEEKRINAVKKAVVALCGGDKDAAEAYYNENIKQDEGDAGRMKWHLDAIKKQVARIEASV